jgi:uncharacterized paraquat-inducible protein A
MGGRVRGHVRCERCDWARFYARFSVARIPAYCPACGRRVIRERNPSVDSPALSHWHAVAEQLGSTGATGEKPPGPER